MRRIWRAACSAVLLAIVATAWPAAADRGPGNLPPPEIDGPVEVEVLVRINKTYNVNTLDETYVIDGYVELEWTDPRLAFEPAPGAPDAISYQNALAEEAMGHEVWTPVIEFINVVGVPEIPNQEILVQRSGEVRHAFRFLGTFASEMDFRRYPFDTQTFRLQIESFVYERARLEFVNPDVKLAERHASDQWEIRNESAYICNQRYSALADGEVYSRFNVDVTARRLPGYFVWQIFIPLMLIIVTSWSVFWIEGLSERLGTGCTLMLTVVAFNFFVATLLPRLPYNTFIEIVIISGYISIFLSIVAILTEGYVRRQRREAAADRLNVTFRWLFPTAYVTAMVVLANAFLGGAPVTLAEEPGVGTAPAKAVEWCPESRQSNSPDSLAGDPRRAS